MLLAAVIVMVVVLFALTLYDVHSILQGQCGSKCRTVVFENGTWSIFVLKICDWGKKTKIEIVWYRYTKSSTGFL